MIAILDGEPQVQEPGDCDDLEAEVYPEAVEIPDDGIDQDCDGVDSLSESVEDDAEDGMDDGVEDSVESDKAGCGCTAAPLGGVAWPLGLLAFVGLRRRSDRSATRQRAGLRAARHLAPT